MGWVCFVDMIKVSRVSTIWDNCETIWLQFVWLMYYCHVCGVYSIFGVWKCGLSSFFVAFLVCGVCRVWGK